MNNTEVKSKSASTNEKFTLIKKCPKGKMTTLLLVFAWICVCNVIFQILHHSWHDMPIANWAFFLSVTVFFMQEELKPRDRFLYTLVGGSVGLLLGAGIIMGTKLFVGWGLQSTMATCICLIVAIGLLILLNPIIPMFFNNVGFCYFIVSLFDSSKTVAALPKHLLSLLMGSLILNLGCIVILKAYKKIKAKKAK